MEDALRASEEKYRLLFQNMAEGFALYELLYDQDGQPADWRVLEVNDAYTRHTGIARERIVGRRISELFPAAIPEYLPRFARVVATQKPVGFRDVRESRRPSSVRRHLPGGRASVRQYHRGHHRSKARGDGASATGHHPVSAP